MLQEKAGIIAGKIWETLNEKGELMDTFISTTKPTSDSITKYLKQHFRDQELGFNKLNLNS